MRVGSIWLAFCFSLLPFSFPLLALLSLLCSLFSIHTSLPPLFFPLFTLLYVSLISLLSCPSPNLPSNCSTLFHTLCVQEATIEGLALRAYDYLPLSFLASYILPYKRTYFHTIPDWTNFSGPFRKNSRARTTKEKKKKITSSKFA